MKLRLASTALDGQTVTLTVMQEGVTAGPLTAAAWGRPLPDPGTGVGGIDVVLQRTVTRTAPECVFFDVSGWTGFDTEPGDVINYDARHHDLIYLWTFGDAGATFDVPEKLLPEWRDANVAQGPFVTHTYEAHGTYDWSLLVIEPSSGKTATASGTVAVADPNVTFAGANTCYLHPAGNFAGAPAGALTATSFSAAMTALTDKTYRRVMIARGIDMTVPAFPNPTGGGIFHFVAAPGTGARPILRPDLGNSYGMPVIRISVGAGPEVTFDNLDLRGPWNPVTEIGDQFDGLVILNVGYSLVNRCKFTGFTKAVGWGKNIYDKGFGGTDQTSYVYFNGLNNRTAMNACHITDWRNFGVYAEGHGRNSFTGTQITHNVNAMSGGDRLSNSNKVNRNDHGPIRDQSYSPHYTFLDGCDLFSRTGWYENISTYRTQQPCLRWNQAGVEKSLLNCQRTTMEGGYYIVSLSRANYDTPQRLCPAVFDHVIFVGSHMTRAAIGAASTGITLRNVLAIVPDVPRIHNIYEQRMVVRIEYQQGGKSGSGEVFPENYYAPNKAHGVTVINHMSPANAVSGGQNEPIPIFQGSGGNLTDPGILTIIEENNISHQPNYPTPVIGQGPLDQTPLWAPREKGYISYNHPTLLTRYATPIGSVWRGTPLAGSPARGGATSDEAPRDDIRLRNRPVHPSMGAVEA